VDPRLKQHPLGFYEIAEKPTVKELQEYYAEKYYQDAKGSYEHEYTQDELKYFRSRLVQHHAALKAVQSQASISGGGRFLDVGCGEGFAMAYFREQGYDIKGLDFSSAGVESKNPQCLDVLITGDLFELLQSEISSGKRYDIVWLQNVLEHVLDPVDLMKTLRNLIAPDGVAVITVPNDCSSTQKEALVRGHIDQPFWVVPPDHLSYFSNASLNNIARETGWEVADLLGDFPIDWYLYHPGSNYVMNPLAGKNAHWARVQLENLFAEKPVEDVLGLWRAMAKVGSGRDLTGFITPISDSV
jgi:2-polyprenyl-3-methyl-5-hydroxy-6-metoxy-1,4-benzoquinol methylase